MNDSPEERVSIHEGERKRGGVTEVRSFFEKTLFDVREPSR